MSLHAGAKFSQCTPTTHLAFMSAEDMIGPLRGSFHFETLVVPMATAGETPHYCRSSVCKHVRTFFCGLMVSGDISDVKCTFFDLKL